MQTSANVIVPRRRGSILVFDTSRGYFKVVFEGDAGSFDPRRPRKCGARCLRSLRQLNACQAIRIDCPFLVFCCVLPGESVVA